MRKIYFLLFYKLFKFSELAPSKWLSDWKASLVIDVLILFFFTSLINYYKVFFDVDSNLGEGSLLLIVVSMVSIANYFIFHHKDKWKQIVHDFDLLPEAKNRIISWIVFFAVVLIIVNFIYSFYLYYHCSTSVFK